MVGIQNRLPREIMYVPLLEGFKAALDRALSNLIYDLMKDVIARGRVVSLDF